VEYDVETLPEVLALFIVKMAGDFQDRPGIGGWFDLRIGLGYTRQEATDNIGAINKLLVKNLKLH
jgi:hypothetical protein